MNLILLSCKTDRLNENLQNRLRKIFENKSKTSYVVIDKHIDKTDYELTCSFMKKYGVQYINIIDMNNLNLMKVKNDILDSGCIFIPSINPLDSKSNLERVNIKGILNDYINQGGIIIAEGNACVLLSERAEIFSEVLGNDYNQFKSSIGLIDFSIIPRLSEYKYELCNIIDLSRKYEGVYYGLSDGNAIEVSNNKIEFYGDIIKIEDGEYSVFKGL